jgi:predicted N-acyltransferase
MTWTTEIIESINQVDPCEWDHLVQNRPFANWQWLELTESVLINHQPRYVLIRRYGDLQAGIVSALQTRFQNPLFQSTLGWAIRRYPGLRCSLPLSCDPGLLISHQASVAELLPVLMQGLEDLIQREHISYHTIDHIWPTMPLWKFLQSRGYHRIEHLSEIYLDIQWVSFEDYLKSLTSKKRGQYRRIGRRLEENGISLAVADPLAEDAQTLQNLVNNVFQRHREPNLYVEDLFSRASRLMGDDFKLIIARKNGCPIGCLAMLRNGNEWIGKWVGLDYEQTWNTHTYYGLSAECLRQAIEAGGQRLRMGTTGYQTKRDLAAVEENRIGALAFRIRPIHYLAGTALRIADGLGISGPIAEAPKRKRKRGKERFIHKHVRFTK